MTSGQEINETHDGFRSVKYSKVYEIITHDYDDDD